MRKTLKFLVFVALITLFGCGKTSMDQTRGMSASYLSSTATNYFSTSKKIVLEVYYEPGAEPFVGSTVSGMPYWKILEDNLNAIFKYRSSIPIIIVPKAIADMTAIPAQNKSKWTPDDIVNLHSTYKQSTPSDTEALFYIYFVKGVAAESTSVIAESINGTPVIGVFKDVITTTGGPIVQRYVEQSTLVHEMGHALGFVNNGVPMKTPHQDTAHGAHSTNSNCVMYWMNEGKTDMIGFVARFITTGETVMWGPEIIEDAKAFSK